MAKPTRQSPTTFRLRVSAGRDPDTGRRRWVTRTVEAKNERDAQKKQDRLQQEVDDGRHAGSEMTMRQLLERYLEHGRWSRQVARDYRAVARDYILPTLGDRKLYRVGAAELDALYDHLERSTDLGAARIYRVHTVLSGAFSQAVKWRLVMWNPARDASPPPVPKPKITRPEVEVIDALLTFVAAADPDFYTLLYLDADAGGRRSELLALRWRHVDLEAATLKIEWAIDPFDNKTLKRPKTDAGNRTVSLHAGTIEVLREHRRRQRRNLLLAEGEAFVFPRATNPALPWRPDVTGHRLKELREQMIEELEDQAAGVETVTLHRLRHYVATELIAAGVDIVTVAGRLGHARASVTADVYAEWKPAKDREAADVLGRRLEQARRAKGD